MAQDNFQNGFPDFSIPQFDMEARSKGQPAFGIGPNPIQSFGAGQKPFAAYGAQQNSSQRWAAGKEEVKGPEVQFGLGQQNLVPNIGTSLIKPSIGALYPEAQVQDQYTQQIARGAGTTPSTEGKFYNWQGEGQGGGVYSKIQPEYAKGGSGVGIVKGSEWVHPELRQWHQEQDIAWKEQQAKGITDFIPTDKWKAMKADKTAGATAQAPQAAPQAAPQLSMSTYAGRQQIAEQEGLSGQEYLKAFKRISARPRNVTTLAGQEGKSLMQD